MKGETLSNNLRALFERVDGYADSIEAGKAEFYSAIAYQIYSFFALANPEELYYADQSRFMNEAREWSYSASGPSPALADLWETGAAAAQRAIESGIALDERIKEMRTPCRNNLVDTVFSNRQQHEQRLAKLEKPEQEQYLIGVHYASDGFLRYGSLAELTPFEQCSFAGALMTSAYNSLYWDKLGHSEVQSVIQSTHLGEARAYNYAKQIHSFFGPPLDASQYLRVKTMFSMVALENGEELKALDQLLEE